MPSGYNALAARPKNKLAYPGQDVVNAFTQGLGPMLYGAAKGTAATVAGLPGDIEQLARQLLLSGAAPDSYTAKNMAAQALLPTSDRVKAMLPSLSSFGAGPQAQYTENTAASLGQNIVGNLVAPKALPAVAQMTGQGAAATGRYVAPKAGQLAEEYMVRTGGILPLDVYHGTPHTLPPTARNPLGEFDASKIGTGEGAQAYGYGIYTAENPAVAQKYKEQLGTQMQYKGQQFYDPIVGRKTATTGNTEIDDYLLSYLGDTGVVRKELLNAAKEMRASKNPQALKEYQILMAEFRKIRPDVTAANTGNLYKIDLPDEKIAKMLDFDKPLSQQKNILDALTPENMGLTLRPSVDGGYMAYLADGKPIGLQVKGVTPEVFREKWISRLREMGDLEGGAGRAVGYLGGTTPGDLPPLVSKALRQAGIPGIKYLDEGSRVKPNITDQKLARLYDKYNGDAEAAVNEMMRGVYNTPKEKEAIRKVFLKQLQTPQTRNFVVFPGEEKSMTILERNSKTR